MLSASLNKTYLSLFFRQVQRNEDGEDENPTADDDHPKSVVSHSSGPADSEPNLQASGCIPGDGNATGTSTANNASDEAPLATAEEFGEVTIRTLCFLAF